MSGFLSLVAIAAWAVSVLTVQALDIEDLWRIAADRRTGLESLRVSVTTVQDFDLRDGEPPSPWQLRSLSRTAIVDLVNRRYRVERTIEDSVSVVPRTAHFGFDGDVQSTLLPDELIGVVDHAAQVDALEESGVLTAALLCAPRPGGLGVDDSSLESFLAHGVLLPEMERVAGQPCFVVEAYLGEVHYATLWLDAEMGLLPRRKVVIGHDGMISSWIEVEATETHEVGAGRQMWLPTRWSSEVSMGGRVYHSYHETHAGSVVVNPAADESLFSIEFPPGTLVTDKVAGLTYLVGDGGEEIEVVANQTPALGAPPPATLIAPARETASSGGHPPGPSSQASSRPTETTVDRPHLNSQTQNTARVEPEAQEPGRGHQNYSGETALSPNVERFETPWMSLLTPALCVFGILVAAHVARRRVPR